MTPGGDLITIQPGQLSAPTIASKALIGAAIKLGSEKEIGIIITTSYEMEQARLVSASVPYIYTEVDEAKSKLLDPSIDYLGTLNATKINYQNEKILIEKEDEITSLKTKVSELEEQLKLASGQALKTELESKLAKCEADYKQLLVEVSRKDTRIKEYEDQINSLNSNLNKVRADLGAAQQNLPTLQKKLDENDVTIQNLNNEVASLKSELFKKTEESRTVSENLREATETIDSMKSTFNGICSKFGIIKNEEGEFVMQVNE
jgi:chromosome segregation ATPase